MRLPVHRKGSLAVQTSLGWLPSCPGQPRHSLRPQLGVDAGTVNTLVYLAGAGVLLEEPSVVAVDAAGSLFSTGRAAEGLVGREPPGVRVLRPLRAGVVTDFEAATAMLSDFMNQVVNRHGLIRSDAVVCVPSGATSIEREALVAAVAGEHSRCRRATLVEEPVAAALGVGGDSSRDRALVVVDVGGGTTEMAAVSTGDVVSAFCRKSIRVAGNDMDEAVAETVRRHFGIVIGQRAAERLKMAVGFDGDERPETAGGMDLASAAPRSVAVPTALVSEALARPFQRILETLDKLLSELHPEVAEDVVRSGLFFTGGGALLRGLPEAVRRRTGMEVHVPPDPLRSVVRGLATVMGDGATAATAA